MIAGGLGHPGGLKDDGLGCRGGLDVGGLDVGGELAVVEADCSVSDTRPSYIGLEEAGTKSRVRDIFRS